MPRHQIQVAADPRTAQAWLLRQLDQDTRNQDLHQPVLVLVPSAALREHVTASVANALGARLGLRILTLATFSAELLRTQCAPVWLPIMARRAVTAEQELADLTQFDDGAGLPVGSIRDLLDAGLDPISGPRITQLVHGQSKHCQAIIRAAIHCRQLMLQSGVRSQSDIYALAAQHLRDGARTPARSIYVHGFDDAISKVLSLLQALLERGAHLTVSLPSSDPGFVGKRVIEDFARWLDARLVDLPGQGKPVRYQAFSAGDLEAEVREVVYRVRAELAAGTAPECVGIVARDLEPRLAALRRWCSHLGVPMSAGAAPAAWFARHRRLAAVLSMMRQRQATPIATWFQSLGSGHRLAAGATLVEILLGLRVLGMSRLGDLVRFDVDRMQAKGVTGIALPMARAATIPLEEISDPTNREDPEAEAEDAEWISQPVGQDTSPRRRFLPLTDLRAARDAALRLVQAMPAAAQTACVAAHDRCLHTLLATELGWDEQELVAALPATDLGDAEHRLELSFDEYLWMVEHFGTEYGSGPLSGSGGGVQVLDSTQVRGLTFSHLFLLGVNRDSWPRRMSEDAFLSAADRAVIARVLPAMPAASRVVAEEALRFAQICSAADAVTVSWLRTDTDGRQLAPSPFVLTWMQGPDYLKLPSDRIDLRQRDLSLDRPLAPSDAIVHSAIQVGMAGTLPLLPSLRAQHARYWCGPAVIDARWTTLSTFESRHRLPPELAGWVGPRAQSDPRSDELPVTSLEAYARCPWRTWLTKFLRIEQSPDPLGALPDINRKLLGTTVHRALEFLVGETSRDHAARTAQSAAPSLERVRTAVQAAVDEVAVHCGVHLPALLRTLRERTLPFVASAVRSDWGNAEPFVILGCEVPGQVEIETAHGNRRIRYRADRADRIANQLRLTDFKTGKPPTESLDTRLRSGKELQAAAYAIGGVGHDSGTTGRYLHLNALDRDPVERVCLRDEVTGPFTAVAQTLFAGVDAGQFFPRVELPNGKPNPECRNCEVKEACILQDSGLRARLVEQLSTGHSVAHAVWHLPSGKLPEQPRPDVESAT